MTPLFGHPVSKYRLRPCVKGLISSYSEFSIERCRLDVCRSFPIHLKIGHVMPNISKEVVACEGV